MQVIVHEPGATADPINQGFILAPGVSALASISKKRVKVKVHNLKLEKSRCMVFFKYWVGFFSITINYDVITSIPSNGKSNENVYYLYLKHFIHLYISIYYKYVDLHR